MILKPIDSISVFAEKAEPHIGVFASKEWLSIYGESLVMIGIYKDENQIIGGFYYLKTKKFGFDFIKLPPYTPHCGLFFIGESTNQSSKNNFTKEVVLEVCNHFNELKSTLTILAFPSNVIDMQPFIWDKYKVIPNYTYRLSLEKTLEEIKSNFESKTRNAINKAVKEGVEISLNSLTRQQVFASLVTNLDSAGANIYYAPLKNILFGFSDESNSFCYVARKNNEVLGLVFCIYDKNVCYYLLAAVGKNIGVQGVNNLLVLHCVEKAQQLGCKVFDFEGSMLKGVEKFFRSFGPEMFPYYTANKAKFFLEILLKFKKREIF